MIIHCPDKTEVRGLMAVTGPRYSLAEAERVWDRYRKDTCYGVASVKGVPTVIWAASIHDELVEGKRT